MLAKSNTILFIFSITLLLPSIVFANEPKTTSENTVELTINNSVKEYLTLSDIANFSTKTPFLFYDDNYKTEIQKPIRCLNTYEPCLLTSSLRQSHTTNNDTITNINNSNIDIFVDDIARKVSTDPVNAKLRFDDETGKLEEVSPHTDGVKLDIEQAKIQIINTVSSLNNNNALELPITINPAQITSISAKELGIQKLIGKGESDFKGSTKSRIHNITTAAKRFDGLVIAPNEEFSFVSILGPVDGEHGYKEELVILDNETKPEYGGGICQVSTTVFRGAILSGMKITQRRNHSYPVHYYMPIGFDATVYVPAPDFRFINNTPGHILLNMEMEGTKLVFKYYGTDDGREVEMKGPFITDRQPNGAMKTYFTQKVTDKSGNDIIDDVFKSNYKSPDDYPHPGDVAKFTEKPEDWSKSQWKDYKIANGL
ncbi:MAG: VanW family protein [Candidatus Moraniibacteriota bacterium]|jgi:vancomycin resistance protein YoaR